VTQQPGDIRLCFNGFSGPERLGFVRRWHGRRGRLPVVELYPWLSPIWRRWRELEDEQQ
jgi:hypothetical protein